jgi:hypothetical protein
MMAASKRGNGLIYSGTSAAIQGRIIRLSGDEKKEFNGISRKGTCKSLMCICPIQLSVDHFTTCHIIISVVSRPLHSYIIHSQVHKTDKNYFSNSVIFQNEVLCKTSQIPSS